MSIDQLLLLLPTATEPVAATAPPKPPLFCQSPASLRRSLACQLGELVFFVPFARLGCTYAALGAFASSVPRVASLALGESELFALSAESLLQKLATLSGGVQSSTVPALVPVEESGSAPARPTPSTKAAPPPRADGESGLIDPLLLELCRLGYRGVRIVSPLSDVNLVGFQPPPLSAHCPHILGVRSRLALNDCPRSRYFP
jgi:hypothetical protein